MKITKKDLTGLAKYLRECRDFGTFWTIKVYSESKKGAGPRLEATCLLGTLRVDVEGKCYVNGGTLQWYEWAQLHEPPRGCLMSKYEFWAQGILRWFHGDLCYPVEMKPGSVIGEGDGMLEAVGDACAKLGLPAPFQGEPSIPSELAYGPDSMSVRESPEGALRERVRIIAWRG
jgi:hypothetical protein